MNESGQTDRIGGCFLSLLMHAVVASDCSVSSFCFHSFSIRTNQNRSHHSQRSCRNRTMRHKRDSFSFFSNSYTKLRIIWEIQLIIFRIFVILGLETRSNLRFLSFKAINKCKRSFRYLNTLSYLFFILTVSLSDWIGLNVTVVIFASPDESTLRFHGIGYHIVDQTVFIPNFFGFKRRFVFAINDKQLRQTYISIISKVKNKKWNTCRRFLGRCL